ncbi:Uncharacterised protein [Vibrio cholerae]|nr:Uncharacterised protein [Vibrio cholerae]
MKVLLHPRRRSSRRDTTFKLRLMRRDGGD